MASYYDDVTGNLYTGDVAMASDIHQIQRNIKDALKNLNADLSDNEAYVLGVENEYKNSFILTPAPKNNGEYIDSYNMFDGGDTLDFNYMDIRQPILKTKTSLYSILTRLKNTSNRDIPVTFEIQDEDEKTIRSNTVTLPANQDNILYEVVFDLDFFSTPPNLNYEELVKSEKYIPLPVDEDDYTVDVDNDNSENDNESEVPEFSTAGVSTLYFVIKRTNLNETDLSTSGDTELDKPNFEAGDLGVYYQEGSAFPEEQIFCETRGENSQYVKQTGNIWYKDIYAKEPTYLCTGGKAIIGGEKVLCQDTHISVEGGGTEANVLTQIYLGTDGHLHFAHTKTSYTTNIDEFEPNPSDVLPTFFLPVALILTYSNAVYGTGKEPLIIQHGYGQLPASHHERLRKLEKRIDWTDDIALPGRIKYVLSGEDLIDENGESLADLPFTTFNEENEDDSEQKKKDVETISNENIITTTDEEGNSIVQLTDSVIDKITITLKEKLKDDDGDDIKLKETDVLNASAFSEISNMVHDSKNGTLMLKKEEAKEDTDSSKSKKTTTKTKKLSSKAEKIVKKFVSTQKISQADKETLFKEFDIDTNKSSTKTVKISATSINSSNLDNLIDSKNLSKLLKELGVESETTKKTVTKSVTGTYNPWADDSLTSEEKIKKKKYKINEREYIVKSDEKGRESYYPGMTFYTDKNYKLKKLYIPIFKFKNCSKVKVFIYKRQDTNNKKNTVELGKLMHSPKTFSLKKAKEKGKYQYMEEGFTLDFGDSGLSLPKAQYVIVVLPIPKSEDGSVFVKTYKPKNSKDFCIKYKGDSKAAHFELVDRYQEIWYNPSKMVVEEENYYKKGHVISKTVTFEGESLERISSIKPIVKKHLTSEETKADSYQLYVNTGGSWIKVEPGRYNKIKDGGAKTFKWKLVFKSDGKKSPKLEYSKKDKYAIKFLLKREKKAKWMNAAQVVDINKTMCITSKQISGNDVLKEYIGDSNFATKQSRFQGHEFARIWADNENNDNLLVDIQGSDLDMSYEFDKTIDGEKRHFEGKAIPTWTYHYCDLTLDDFSKTSVDYSDYDPTIEYDENNLRLKLDSNHAYNDDEILITPLKEFVEVANDIDDKSDEADTSITTTTDTTSSTSTSTTSTSTNTSTTSNKNGPSLKVKNSNVVENQLFLKKTFDSPFDLSKYTGLKIKFTTETQETTAATIEGLGLYISSEIQSEVPSNVKYLPENVLPLKENTEVLVPTIDPDTSSESYYEGQLLAIKHDISDDDGDKIFEGTGYYQYVKHYNEEEGKYVYKLEQALDLRPYTIYNFGVIKATPDDNTYEARIELDQNSTNLRNVREIGIISLNDENSYKFTETSLKTEISAVYTLDTSNNTKRGKIIIKLKDSEGTGIQNQKILIDGNTYQSTTNGSGNIAVYETVNTQGSFSVRFEGNLIGETYYSSSETKISYDFSYKNELSYTNIEEQQAESDTSSDSDSSSGSDSSGSSEEEEQQQEEIKPTTLTATKISAGSFKLTLTDHEGKELKSQTIKEGTTTYTTDNKGEVTISELGGESGEKTFEFEKIKIDKTTHGGIKIKVKYDYTPTYTGSQKDNPVVQAKDITITLQQINAINEDWIKIYDPTKEWPVMKSINSEVTTVYTNGNITINSTTYRTDATEEENLGDKVTLTPAVTQINIKQHASALNQGPTMLCYINNPFQGGLSHYKHMGIQLAADVYIPKDSLKINICKGTDGQDIIESVNLPTLNGIYYPSSSGTVINLSKIFKKIDLGEEEIRSISISATKYFYEHMAKIIVSDSEKPAINLFLGNIMLYRAETIPFYHDRMRFKLYNTNKGEITHYSDGIDDDTIQIRKIGSVLDYD